MLKKLFRKLGSNPLDRMLQKAKRKESVLLFWNRGLGDIALGVFAMVHRIKELWPEAKVTILTRPNLVDGFTLLGGVDVLVDPDLKRGASVSVPAILQKLHVDPKSFDLIIDRPDPTHWVSWQLGKVTPLLHWEKKWDILCDIFLLDKEKKYVGAHVQTETGYASWRDWPLESWRELFQKLTDRGEEVVLFGFAKDPLFAIPGVIDLRGETSLFQLLSIIKNRCKALVVPDSGISSMTYFLDYEFPIQIVSLWAEPNMGILKQNVASPNRLLTHTPILGKDKVIANITAEEVCREIH